jgi:hypothetical protein
MTKQYKEVTRDISGYLTMLRKEIPDGICQRSCRLNFLVG